MMKKRLFDFCLIALGVLLLSPTLMSQEVIPLKGYQEPPDIIKDIVLAPRHENVSLSSLSPDGKWFLNTLSDGLTPLERLAIPFMNLGGLEVDTAANRSRGLTTGGSTGYELIPWEGGNPVRIDAPAGTRVSGARWAPDGSKLAFFAHAKNETNIYVADPSNGRTTKITRRPVLATTTTSFEWSADGNYILAVLIPENRDAKPKQFVPENYLRVRVSSEGKNSLRTYPSLLEDEYEESMYEYYATGQIVKIDVDRRRAADVGKPGLYSSISFAPDGNYLRVTTVQKPFSNIVPVSSFGSVNELWDIEGNVIEEISKREMTEGISQNNRNREDKSDPPKRSLRWRPDGQGISYLQKEPVLEKEDGDDNDDEDGDDKKEPKDRVIQWLPPYGDDDIRVIYESEKEMSGVDYSADCQTLFIYESGSGRAKAFAIFLDEPFDKYPIYDYRTSEFYKTPGSLMTTSEDGERVIRISEDGQSVYLSGTRYNEEWLENAPRPFIDKVEIRTGDKERVFESSEDYYERVTAVLDNDLNKIIISREAPTVIADNYLIDNVTGNEKKLTNNIDFTPEITNARYEMVKIERPDGVTFWATVVLPKDYKEGERLPTMFWFYPREYSSKQALERTKRNTNINSFRSTGVRSMQNLVTLGYAVVLNDFPIMGEQNVMNDNFIPELQRNWTATINTLDRLGYIDRDRLALGGHSYGAFGTANSMIHTSFFRAGIAGAGNYNRTLTPMSFQSERRWLWEARENYIIMSPMLYAERLDGALLMYHGGNDSNVGTFPINSERMFHALNGLNKTTALYMYPYEGHGQSGRETLLDMWARWVEWLDIYVKNPQVKEDDSDDDEEDDDR